MNSGKLIMTATEAAARLGVSTQTVYKYIHTGLLDAVRDPGHNALQIFEPDLYDCLNRLKATKEPARISKRRKGFASLFQKKET